MRGWTMFVLGAVAGAVAVYTVHRLREQEVHEDHEALAHRMSARLQELEERLQPEVAL